MKFESTDIDVAHRLDAADELAAFRSEFVITDPDLIYLDGNSLGRLPQRTVGHLGRAVEQQWGDRLIRVWNDGWINTPKTLGAKIAGLVGAKPDEILVTEATSVNLFKLAVAALRHQAPRTKIVSDSLNFPSDLYILQGITELFDGRYRLELIPSDDGITTHPARLEDALDRDTALISLSHVVYKSAFMYDMADVTRKAHHAGALTLWDLSHSAGAVPVDLRACNADLAVGCTYKYLNGGPGAPAFLYVRKDLQHTLMQPMWGWFAARDPFAFDIDYTPADDLARFRVGTPPMLSMQALEPGLDMLLAAGISRLRDKSIRQSEYLMFLVEQWLEQLGFAIATPREPRQRGSHVSLTHPEAIRINRALIEAEPPAVKVIPDFRAPDNIRFGITPLYTTFEEIYGAMLRLKIIVEDQIYANYSARRTGVT